MSRPEVGFAPVADRRFGERHCLELDLDSGAQVPARARAAAAGMVSDLHLELIADDVALVVSELVTNAVRHAKPPMRLEIQADDRRVTIAVVDGSPGRPVTSQLDEDAEGGRGLALVGLLAAETGVRPNPPGKTVWARLARR